jgi:hypothetical protein
MTAETLERLYREHNAPALRKLRRRLGNELHDQAEDALSSAWLILARLPDSYLDDKQDLTGWLITVSRREALRTLDPAVTPGNLDRRSDEDPFALVVSRDRVRELLDQVRGVPAVGDRGPRWTFARRRALAARMVGLTYGELAQMTGTTYTHVNRSTAEGLKLARATSRYNEA